LDATPDTASDAMRAVHQSTAWQPDTLAAAPIAGSGAREAGVQTANAAGASSDPPAASSQDGQSMPMAAHEPRAGAPAADGGDARAGAPAADGGQGGSAGAPQPSAAGAPAAGSGGAGGGADDLVELALRILFGAAGATVQAAGGVLKGAASAGGLTASLVSGVIESLASAGVCVAQPEQCEQACNMIRSDCGSCAHDDTCREDVRALCGDETAECVHAQD
jgi:hypothetical protein